MTYPIVKIMTKDGIFLNGIINEKKDSKIIVINIHGSASNFYEEDFFGNMFEQFPKKGFSFLSTNNRGNSVMTHTWQRTGSALEKFEDCLIDIDAWIEFVVQKGYTKIILQGHSLGTEKIVYYVNKGKYKNHVKGIILLGFSDSFGCEEKFMKKSESREQLFREAEALIKSGKQDHFLSYQWLSHAGILPKSAGSFLNQFSPNSELSKAFPFRSRKLEFYSKIKVPILAVISSNDLHTGDEVVTDGSEHTVIPVKEAGDLLMKSNKLTELNIIQDTNHDFEGREVELTKIVLNFLLKHNFN